MDNLPQTDTENYSLSGHLIYLIALVRDILIENGKILSLSDKNFSLVNLGHEKFIKKLNDPPPTMIMMLTHEFLTLHNNEPTHTTPLNKSGFHSHSHSGVCCYQPRLPQRSSLYG